MKQNHRIPLTLSRPCSENRRCKTFFTIATIVSILSLFFTTVNAQHIALDIPLTVSPNDADPTALPKQSISTRNIISGIVIDSTEAPLMGASVMLLPKSKVIIGTATNEEGKFSIEIPISYAKDSVIINVSYVGFISQQIRLSRLQVIDHVEVCLPMNNRILGCPVIKPFAAEPKTNYKINQDLIGAPVLIKIPESKSSTTK